MPERFCFRRRCLLVVCLGICCRMGMWCSCFSLVFANVFCVLIVYGLFFGLGFSKSLKHKLLFMLDCAEVAQSGEHSTQHLFVVEGEAEDRVVAGSSPALGTFYVIWNKPITNGFSVFWTVLYLLFCRFAECTYSLSFSRFCLSSPKTREVSH